MPTKKKKIFTMTVVSGDPDAPHGRDQMRTRCWGYYFSRKTAAEAIEGNWTDMSENGYYRYGVLSTLGEGPLAFGNELQWYEFIWDWDVQPRKDGVVCPDYVEAKKIDKPEIYRQMLFGGI